MGYTKTGYELDLAPGTEVYWPLLQANRILGDGKYFIFNHELRLSNLGTPWEPWNRDKLKRPSRQFSLDVCTKERSHGEYKELFIKRFLPGASYLKTTIAFFKKTGRGYKWKGRNFPPLVLVVTTPFRLKGINPPFKTIRLSPSCGFFYCTAFQDKLSPGFTMCSSSLS